MSTATVPQAPNPSKPCTSRERDAYRRRIRALGWTQNEAARRIGKDPGLFSRWLRGALASAVIRGRIDAALAEAEAAKDGQEAAHA